MTPTPSSPAAIGMDDTAGIAKSQRAARREYPKPVAEEATMPLQVRLQRVLHPPIAAGRAPPPDPSRDLDPEGETWTLTTTWNSLSHPTSGVDP